MMKVQELIKNIGYDEAVKYLKNELHIMVKEYDNFGVFNYNQIFSPEVDDYVIECRGLILDKNGEVLGRRWNRFFNYGQQPDITGKFEFEGSEIFEKVDGSTILFWYNPYENKWEISTRGTALAESEQLWYPSFRQAVLEDGLGITEEQFQEFMKVNLKNNTSCVFEYCSIKNRIVTYYDKPTMYLVSIIDNSTGDEAPYEDNEQYISIWKQLSPNIHHIKKFDFNSLEDVVSTARGLQNLQEGYVAKDKNGLRIKIKADLYLKVHKIKGEGQITPKSIASLVIENEADEFLAYFPEYREMFIPYETRLYELIREIDCVWGDTHGIEVQKDYALAIKNYPYSAVLFSMRKTEKPFDKIWEESRLDYRIGLLLSVLDVS